MIRGLKLSRKQRAVAAVLVLAVVALGLGAWLRSGRLVADGAAGETVAVVRRPFAATVTAVGAVKPQIGAEVRVGSRISGRVERLRANIGDRVEKGQVIAELETAELDAQVAERRAELRVAESRLAAVRSLAPEDVARAEAEVARWEATAKLAAEEWARQQVLLERNVVTRAEADAARERHDVAQAQLEAARRALGQARTGETEERAQAEAEVERARAALRAAEVERSFAVIRSPISGVVASVSTQEGETVAAGLNAPTFVTVVDLARLQVDAYVDEVDIGKVEVGQAATFAVDAFPAHDFDARVSAIYPTATIQDNVVKYIVALEIEGEYAGVLRPEMTASVRIRVETRDVLALPSRAVRRDAQGNSVVHVWADGRPEPRVVRVGWRDGPWAEIVDGLAEGERVLLDPPAAAREEIR